MSPSSCQMDSNRPHPRRKSMAVEPTHSVNNVANEEEGPQATLPLHVESSADSSVIEDMELPETPVTGAAQRTRIRNWAAEFSKRNRALKQNTPIPIKKKFICSVCKKELANKDGLKRHFRLHTGEKPFPCNSCQESFNRMDKLRLHERVHMQKSFCCRYCKGEFQSINLLRIHIDHVHTRKKRMNSTTAASSSSSTTSTQQKGCTQMGSLNAHVAANEKKKNVAQIDMKDRRNRTRQQGQASAQNEFNCTQSPPKFKSPKQLHKRDYICGHCGRKFSSKGNLDRHKLTHMSVKAFRCQICNAGFTRAEVLQTHLIAHAKGTLKMIPYKFKACKICGAGCNRNFNLIQHMKTAHPTEDIQPYLRQRMAHVYDCFEKKARAKEAKKSQEAALGHILQPSLVSKPLKKQLLQQQKKKASGNKQQHHVLQKKHILHSKPIIRMPLQKTSIPVTAHAQTLLEAENGTAFPLPDNSRPGPSSSKTCGDCNKRFGTAHDLTVHSFVFHPTKDNGIECGICRKRYRSMSLLSRHYLYSHRGTRNAAQEAIMLLSGFNNAPTTGFQDIASTTQLAPVGVVDRARTQDNDNSHEPILITIEDDSDVEYIETVTHQQNDHRVVRKPQTGTEVKMSQSTKKQSGRNESGLSKASGNADKREPNHLCDHCGALFEQNAGLKRHLERHHGSKKQKDCISSPKDNNTSNVRFIEKRCFVGGRIVRSTRYYVYPPQKEEENAIPSETGEEGFAREVEEEQMTEKLSETSEQELQEDFEEDKCESSAANGGQQMRVGGAVGDLPLDRASEGINHETHVTRVPGTSSLIANESSESRCSSREQGRRFLCDICWHLFQSRGRLTQHIQTAHPGEMPAELLQGLFQCPDCPKSYDNRKSLHSHQRRHHDVL